MKLQHFIVGMLIAVAFIAGTTSFIAGLTVKTGIQTNSSFNATYNKINETLGVVEDASDKFENKKVSSTFDTALQVATFPILNVVFDSYEIIVALMHDMATDLNLDYWIIPVILGIICIILIFAILNAIFGRAI